MNFLKTVAVLGALAAGAAAQEAGKDPDTPQSYNHPQVTATLDGKMQETADEVQQVTAAEISDDLHELEKWLSALSHEEREEVLQYLLDDTNHTNKTSNIVPSILGFLLGASLSVNLSLLYRLRDRKKVIHQLITNLQNKNNKNLQQ